MKVLILAPYPLNEAPSQRFRFEHYLHTLEAHKIPYEFQPFLSQKGWHILYTPGNPIQKIVEVGIGYLRRVKLLFQMGKFDLVFIHREASPFGPPVFEYIISRALKKKMIYDYDDAIWQSDHSNENPIWKWLKWRSKVRKICAWSWKVVPGNSYLADFATAYTKRIVVMPTVINTERHKPTPQNTNTRKLTIGWTGSHSTLFYLNGIIPALQELAQRHSFDFLVIANKNPQLPLKNFRFVKWQQQTEVEDLSLIDIGVMPLDNTEWAKGKCGFKLIQYLALGIPAVASPVGVNEDIITNDHTGYLASTHEQWVHALECLMSDAQKRQELGRNGRVFIEENYSAKSQESKFINLFIDETAPETTL